MKANYDMKRHPKYPNRCAFCFEGIHLSQDGIEFGHLPPCGPEGQLPNHDVSAITDTIVKGQEYLGILTEKDLWEELNEPK